MKRKLVFIVLCCLFYHGANAEENFDIVRMSCVPDANYLNVTPESLTLFSTAIDFKPPKNISSWERAGFYDPRDLKVTCKLSKSVYVITTSQSEKRDSGMCSQSQEITLSLLRNGTPIIKDVIFGLSCYGNPTVTKIAVLDKKSDKDPDLLEVCYEKESGKGTIKYCASYLDEYSNTKSNLPITQKTVKEISIFK